MLIMAMSLQAEAAAKKPVAAGKVSERFPEDERKAIFLEAVEAEKKGTAAADRQYPNDLYQNTALKQQLTTKYRREVLAKYGMTEDSEDWRLIANEGVQKNWVR